MTIKSFEDLEIWQLARELCVFVKKITDEALFNKDYRFRDQIRSASGSIMDNIAEGFERDGNKEFAQFLSIAKASNGEVRSQSYRALDYNYITPEQLEDLLSKTSVLGKKIGRFKQYLKESDFKGHKFK
ncbi:MAG: four helix bundle protein [Bacteroidales bacterium]|nr:four helix bundle protein [Bacteroidales bacterium]